MKIEVFGPGCAKCNRSFEVAQQFLRDRGLEGEAIKHGDIDTMTARGVLRTPTTMVDGEVLVEGRILREKDLDGWLQRHGGAPA